QFCERRQKKLPSGSTWAGFAGFSFASGFAESYSFDDWADAREGRRSEVASRSPCLRLSGSRLIQREVFTRWENGVHVLFQAVEEVLRPTFLFGPAGPTGRRSARVPNRTHGVRRRLAKPRAGHDQ